MTAHYSVAQYVPDPVSGECINIAIFAWDGDRIVARALSDWRRARAFGSRDLATIRNITNRLVELSSPQLSLISDAPHIDVRALRAMIGTWHNAIQFTPPRGSLKDPESLLKEITSQFLHEAPARRRRRARSRTTAVRIAVDHVVRAIGQRVPEKAKELIGKNGQLTGYVEPHIFDVIIGNGKPLAAVQALSFEGGDSTALKRDVDATAWIVEDVKRRHRTLPIGVFLLPSKGDSKLFERARRLFPQLKSDLVPEDKMEQRAKKQAQAVASHIGA